MKHPLPPAAALPCAALALLVPAAGSALAAGDPAVSVPWGDWVVAAGDGASAILVPALVAGILWAARAYLPILGTFLSQSLVERLVRNAADYALNAVAGAVKGRALDVPTGSAVIAKAAQRAIDQAPGWLLKEAGGPAGVAEKVFRTLHLDGNATAASVLAPAIRAIRSAS